MNKPKPIAGRSAHAWLLGVLVCLLPVLLPAVELTGAEQQARVADLLAQARQAVAADRLTIPSGHNAVGYAQQVLDLEPDHPEALAILGTVVARYNTLGGAALERAEALRAREIAKAWTYQRRGERVVAHYNLGESALTPLTERLALVQETPATESKTDYKAMREGLAEMATGYVALSEAALDREKIEEARRYQTGADLLASTVPGEFKAQAELRALGERLDQAEASQASTQAAVLRIERIREPAIFLPPAF